MTISSRPKDAIESIVERVIAKGQEKGSGYVQHHFVSLFSAGVADAEFA
jgi:glutamate mutase epsilon subunit